MSPRLILDNSLIDKLQVEKRRLELQRPQGPRTGGGGNSCSLAISQNSAKLKSLMSQMPELFNGATLGKTLDRIASAKFFVGDQLKLEGQFKDAINYPAENKVVVSRRLCATELVEVSGRAMSLLLHEYLGLAGIDDRNYQISGAFLEKYSVLQQYIPRGQMANVNDKLIRSAVKKFLEEVNDPGTKLGQIAKARFASAEFPIEKDSLQIIAEESREMLRPWRGQERVGDSCIVEGDDAKFSIYLRSEEFVGPTTYRSNLKFQVTATQIFKATFTKKTKSYLDCQALVMDDSVPGKVSESVQVSEIQLIEK